MGRSRLLLPTIVFGFIFIALFAHMFRYETVNQTCDISILCQIVWDRWQQEPCVALMDGRKVCSSENLIRIVASKDASNFPITDSKNLPTADEFFGQKQNIKTSAVD